MNSMNLLLRSTPEEQGISSQAVLDFVNEAEKNIHELHSLMLLRHGRVVAEGWWSPYKPELPHMLWSLSKSFTSTAVGLAVAEGRLTIEDKVLSFFPEEAPNVISEHLAAMRVRDLLSMSTGHAEDTTGAVTTTPDGKWIKAFLALPVEFEPGTHFVYNICATYMLAAIVQKITGSMLIDYLTPRLFEPLGIEGAAWDVSPEGINTGGFGLSIKTEDIARFGQLYLQKGAWNGKRLLPAEWVEQATAKQIENGPGANIDWTQGYGFQFWCAQHHAYRGDGACGQFCLVMPDQDAVLAITAGVDDMQGVLTRFWNIVLPAMGSAPLPAAPTIHQQMVQKLVHLQLPLPQGSLSSPIGDRISGQLYEVEANLLGVDGLVYRFSKDHCLVTLKTKLGDEQIHCGTRGWIEGVSTLLEHRPMKVVACGAWTSEDTYQMVLRFIETPFYVTFDSHFTGHLVKVDSKFNVTFMELAFPTLSGKINS